MHKMAIQVGRKTATWDHEVHQYCTCIADLTANSEQTNAVCLTIRSKDIWHLILHLADFKFLYDEFSVLLQFHHYIQSEQSSQQTPRVPGSK